MRHTLLYISLPSLLSPPQRPLCIVVEVSGGGGGGGVKPPPPPPPPPPHGEYPAGPSVEERAVTARFASLFKAFRSWERRK